MSSVGVCTGHYPSDGVEVPVGNSGKTGTSESKDYEERSGTLDRIL